jgi:hypothetical protein
MAPQQLSLSLPQPAVAASRRRPRRVAREAEARWWFARMRRMVDAAVEWTPGAAPAPRSALPRDMAAA